MTRIAVRYNWGSKLSAENPELYRQLNDVYTTISNSSNSKVSRYVSDDQDPSASADINKNFDIGDIWIRKDTNSAWIMTNRTSDIDVTWTLIT